MAERRRPRRSCSLISVVGQPGRQTAPREHAHHARPCSRAAVLMAGSGPDVVVPQQSALPVLRDGSQDFLAGGSEGDRGAGGGHGGPKGEPRRPPPEPNPLLGQLAHAGWASSLTANLCLPQVGQSKRETLVFKRIRCAQAPAPARACKGPHIRGPVRAAAPVACLHKMSRMRCPARSCA